jgi:AcrR family transcriptional regulator
MSSVPQRATKTKAQIREEILAATRHIAANEGWKAVSMRRLAQEIRYTAPIIYEHFHNKEALMLEIAREQYRLLDSCIEQVDKSGYSPRECVLQTSLAWAGFALDGPANYALITGQLPDFPWHPELREALFATMKPVRVAFERILPYNEDPTPVLNEWMALVHGFIQLRLSYLVADTPIETLSRLEVGVRRFVDGL